MIVHPFSFLIQVQKDEGGPAEAGSNPGGDSTAAIHRATHSSTDCDFAAPRRKYRSLGQDSVLEPNWIETPLKTINKS